VRLLAVRLLRWLYPGLRVKRWLVLFALSVGCLGLGVAFGLNPGTGPALAADLASALRSPAGRPLPRWVLATVFSAAGVALAAVSLRGAALSVVEAVAPEASGALGEVLYWRRQTGRGPHIVAIGGGTGLPVLLRGLKRYTGNITAVVTVGDDGGSSGRLRGELGILPPGDIRNCLLALADTEPLMTEVLQHRFQRGSLAGHTVGNVLLGGLCEVTGDFVAAIEAASRVLAVRGRVLPSTVRHVTLAAELEDGRTVHGETAIAAAGGRIRRLRLVPEDADALPQAVEAVLGADVVVIGPGSLYTSLLPNLCLPALRQALQRTRALRVFVVNVMTQPGETSGYSAADHLAALQAHLGRPGVDLVLVNSGRVSEERLAPYREQGAAPVVADLERCAALGVQVVARDVVSRQGLVRHDPDRLAAAVLEEALRRLGPPGPRHLLDYYLLQERLRQQRRRREAGD
jgi:uncharacterized cofD-like protein